MAPIDPDALTSVIGPLGFKNRRGITLIKFSKNSLKTNWKHAGAFSNVGEYASAKWCIFVFSKMPSFRCGTIMPDTGVS